MLPAKLNATFKPQPMTFEQGVSACNELFGRLSALPAFASGWAADGLPLKDNERAFYELQLSEMSREQKQFESYSILAESAAKNAQGVTVPDHYFLAVHFGGKQAPELGLMLDIAQILLSLDLARAVVALLIEWAPLQHLAIMDPYYAMEESPIGLRCTGLGWAGWVLFRPEPAALPEGTIIEPMGRGSFIATQERFWDVPDRAGVKRGQELELALNALGMLPTGADLRDGTWGQGG